VKEIDEEQVSLAQKCDKEKTLQTQLADCEMEASRYCLTADCVLTTYDVLHRMNLTVDPCDDFWLYSCGGWLQDQPDLPADQESWGIEDEMEASLRRYISQRLTYDSPCSDDDMTTDCKMRLLYSRCIDTETIDSVGAKPLQDILDDFGGWSALGQYSVLSTPAIFVTVYTPWAIKKRASFIFEITLANMDRF